MLPLHLELGGRAEAGRSFAVVIATFAAHVDAAAFAVIYPSWPPIGLES